LHDRVAVRVERGLCRIGCTAVAAKSLPEGWRCRGAGRKFNTLKWNLNADCAWRKFNTLKWNLNAACAGRGFNTLKWNLNARGAARELVPGSRLGPVEPRVACVSECPLDARPALNLVLDAVRAAALAHQNASLAACREAVELEVFEADKDAVRVVLRLAHLRVSSALC
jgi:hypothetical protein